MRVGELIEMKYFILYVTHKKEIIHLMQTEKINAGELL